MPDDSPRPYIYTSCRCWLKAALAQSRLVLGPGQETSRRMSPTSRFTARHAAGWDSDCAISASVLNNAVDERVLGPRRSFLPHHPQNVSLNTLVSVLADE